MVAILTARAENMSTNIIDRINAAPARFWQTIFLMGFISPLPEKPRFDNVLATSIGQLKLSNVYHKDKVAKLSVVQSIQIIF